MPAIRALSGAILAPEPQLYPRRTIWVHEQGEGAADGGDGTRANPYRHLSQLFADDALEQVCQALNGDYYRVRVKVSPIRHTLADGEEAWAAFDGLGRDYAGHLVFQPWSGDSWECPVTLSRSLTCAPLNAGGAWEDADTPSKKAKFYQARHASDGFAWASSVALFRNLHGVLFIGCEADLKIFLKATGTAQDAYGNNSPAKIAVALAGAVFQNCGGCGFHKCKASAAASLDLRPPDPLDIDYESAEDVPVSGGGGGGSGGGGGCGHGRIDFPGAGGSGPAYVPSTVTPEELPPADPPAYIKDSIAYTWDFSSTVALAAWEGCDRLRLAQCHAAIACNGESVCGLSAAAVAFRKCSHAWARDCRAAVKADVTDRQYTHVSRVVSAGRGTIEETITPLHEGAAGTEACADTAGSRSSFRRLEVECGAFSTARVNPRLPAGQQTTTALAQAFAFRAARLHSLAVLTAQCLAAARADLHGRAEMPYADCHGFQRVSTPAPRRTIDTNIDDWAKDLSPNPD